MTTAAAPRLGGVAAAHPLAVRAGLNALSAGGTAVDAAIAAQAVLAVVAPDACGLGGDGLLLVRTAEDDRTTAVTGAGAAARAASSATSDGGGSITVPGLVGAWMTASDRWGALDPAQILAPAVGLARRGYPVEGDLIRAVQAQRARLVRGGAEGWSLLSAKEGTWFVQPELAAVLAAVGAQGASSFYLGPLAEAVAAAVAQDGGALDAGDLAAHQTQMGPPVSTPWQDGTAHVQPPPSQGVLLAMALAWLQREGLPEGPERDHVLVELTEATFTHRDSAARRGAALIDEPLEVDRVRSAGRGGPRAYLHTAGVATVDAAGTTVSSLVSVFDDFGSGIFVPEGGFVLNNRAGGFTGGDNAFTSGGRPVHTLAPALLELPSGPVALATPGADGQVQTLLQVLTRAVGDGWEAALLAPRWRSEGGRLLIEGEHPSRLALERTGHDVVRLPEGDSRFGAVVCAGLVDGVPFAFGDGRRSVTAGIR